MHGGIMSETHNSDDILSKTVKKEAQLAARKELKKIHDEDDQLEYDLEDEVETGHDNALKFDEVIEALKQEVADNEYDIFDLGTRLFEEANCDVSYSIYKNNQQLTTQNPPFSYDLLQSEYGGGSYRIQLKLLNRNNRIFKTQTRTVAEPVRTKKSSDNDSDKAQDINGVIDRLTSRDRENSDRLLKVIEDQKTETKENMKEMLMAFKESTSLKEKPAMDFDKLTPLIAALAPVLAKMFDRKDNSGEMLTKVMEVQMKSQEDTQKMMMTIMDKTSESQKTLAEQFSKAIEHVGDQIASIRDSKDDKALDPFKLMEMVKEAEKSGFEQFKMIQELAKEQAGNGKDKEESITQTMIKALAPALMANVMQTQQAQAPKPQATPSSRPTATRPVRPNVPVSRPVLPAPNNLQRGAVRPVSTQKPNFEATQAGTSTVKNPAQNNLQAGTQQQAGVQNRSTSVTNTNVNAKASDKVGNASTKIVNVPIGDTINGANSNKIKEVLFAVIIDKFAEGKCHEDHIEEIGRECVQKLVEKDIQPITFARDFNVKVLDDVIKENPEFLEDYKDILYKLHAYIIEFINTVVKTMEHKEAIQSL
jgi:hypothetical protein